MRKKEKRCTHCCVSIYDLVQEKKNILRLTAPIQIPRGVRGRLNCLELLKWLFSEICWFQKRLFNMVDGLGQFVSASQNDALRIWSNKITIGEKTTYCLTIDKITPREMTPFNHEKTKNFPNERYVKQLKFMFSRISF